MQNKQNFSFKNGRMNQPPIPQAPQISFSSGMTSQQKFQSIIDSVQSSLAGKFSPTIKGCQMHPKSSPKCRKCQAIIQQSQQAAQSTKNNLNQICSKQQFILIEQIPQQLKLNNQNPKNHLNQKLQLNIVTSNKYKILREFKSVKEVLGDLSSDQISIEAYKKGTNQDPSQFMITLFRIIQLKPTKPQLLIMLHSNNVNIRALAVIYIRISLDFEQMYPFLKKSFDDNKLINAFLTVGQLSLKLMSQQGMDQGGIRMPRIPTRIQKAIDKKINDHNTIYVQTEEFNPSYRQIDKINSFQHEHGQQNQNRQERSRSRDKIQRKRSDSSSSSSSSCSSGSSSSSSSNSSDQNQQKKQIIYKKQQKVSNQYSSLSKTKVLNDTNKSSLDDIKSRIQQSIKQNEQKQLKKKLLMERYKAQDKIQQNNQDKQQIQQDSDSVQKYQMN